MGFEWRERAIMLRVWEEFSLLFHTNVVTDVIVTIEIRKKSKQQKTDDSGESGDVWKSDGDGERDEMISNLEIASRISAVPCKNQRQGRMAHCHILTKFSVKTSIGRIICH